MRLAIVPVTVIAMTVMLAGQERDRAKVPDALKWNLADIYPSESAWRAQKETVEKELRSSGSSRARSAPRPRRSPMRWR